MLRSFNTVERGSDVSAGVERTDVGHWCGTEGARLVGCVGGGLLGAALGAFLVLKLKEARLQSAVT